jgi:hypothetical protein
MESLNMAATAIARVTGRVLNVSNRSGTARATGNAYSMTILTVLVADRGVTELILPREWAHEYPRDGDDLDLVVEFSGRANGALGSTILDVWTSPAHASI